MGNRIKQQYTKEQKKNSQRWSRLLAGAALCMSLTACGASNEAATGEVPVQNGQESTETSITESSATPETTMDATEESVPENTDAEAEVLGTYPDGSSPVYSGVKCKLTVDGQEIVIAMYDNTAADAFLERLPLEDLSFFDLSGVEKPVQRPEEPFSLGEEEPGYDLVAGEMVIYRPWGNFTIFYDDFRYSPELVPLGKVESGLEILAGQTEDFTGTMELIQE